MIAYQVLHWEWIGSKNVPLALYGSAIGIIVGFRNNSAYARWWEARGLWGQIVNNSRSLARQVCSTMRSQRAERAGRRPEPSSERHAAPPHPPSDRLRPRAAPAAAASWSPWEEITPLLERRGTGRAAQQSKNVPLTLQQTMGRMLRSSKRPRLDRSAWNGSRWISNLDDLADAQGGTERIKNTPMPKQYDYFPRLFVQIYCLLLPVGMVENLGWFTPLGSTLVGFMFLALDKIGRDLEDPFDNKIYDIPLTAITRTIDINLRQLLGETELPLPEQAVRGVLW